MPDSTLSEFQAVGMAVRSPVISAWELEQGEPHRLEPVRSPHQARSFTKLEASSLAIPLRSSPLRDARTTSSRTGNELSSGSLSSPTHLALRERVYVTNVRGDEG